jgi:hypothetical protein
MYKKYLKQIREIGINKIVLAGPHRSGISIISNILSKELELDIVNETDFYVDNIGKFLNYIKNNDNIIIQAPTLSYFLHNIPYNDMLILYLYRDINDIIKSQNKTGIFELNDNKLELKETWTDLHNDSQIKFLRNFFKNDSRINWLKPVSEVKYQIWEIIQQPLLKVEYINIKYEKFKTHSMWVNEEERINIKSNHIK